MASTLGILSLLLIILPLTVDFKIVSNVFFGVAIFSLLLIIIAWVSSKKTGYANLKDKEQLMSDEAVTSYIPNITKVNNNDRNIARKKRSLYQVSFSLTLTIISGSIALIFAFL